MYLVRALKLFLIIFALPITLEASSYFKPALYKNFLWISSFELSSPQPYIEKNRLKEKFIPLSKKPRFCSQICYLSDEVTNYIEEILTILQANSINRDKINWEEFRYKFYRKMNGCAFTWQTYSRMQEILNLIEDNHSFFLEPIDAEQIHGEENFLIEHIKGELLQKKIAYLFVPGTLCTTGKYAQKLQDTIRILDKKKPKKWIIDLRGNSGGNMWEILLGLAPFFEDGVQGFFGDNDLENLIAWVYEKGKVKIISNTEDLEIESLEPYYSVKRKNFKIAILIDQKTCSSGEAIAISFKGKKNTHFFGSNTYGLTTGNANYDLTDGAAIYLTECYFFDRHKNKYTDGLSPDTITNPDSDEACLNSAIKYLNS